MYNFTIVLGYMIGSARLLILPLVSLICCGLTSFGLMYFATLSMHVMSTTLSLMMSVTIALTIDYSLFTLTRLREELTQKRGFNDEINVDFDSNFFCKIQPRYFNGRSCCKYIGRRRTHYNCFWINFIL